MIHGPSWVALALLLGMPVGAAAGPVEEFWTAYKSQSLTGMENALATGAPPEFLRPDDHGETLLMSLAALGRADAVKALLDHGADPNAHGDSTLGGLATMHVAAAKGYVEIVNLLIDHGADVEIREPGGMTPLAVAALDGQTRVIALLAARGANLNTRSALGATPLLYASQAGEKGAVSLLLDLGADPTQADADGLTPYEAAATSNQIPAETKSAILAILRPPIAGNLGPPGPAAVSTKSRPSAISSCWDAPAIARGIMQANPGHKWKHGELMLAVEMAQRGLGCPVVDPMLDAPPPVIVPQQRATPGVPTTAFTNCTTDTTGGIHCMTTRP